MAIRGLGAVSGVHPDKLAALQKLLAGRKPAAGKTYPVVTPTQGAPVKAEPRKPKPAVKPKGSSDLLTRIAERIMAERRAKQRGSYLR